ncbi:MAG: GMC family oxidoreductase [Pseudonocardia sp.]|nr:GMC family oxidoreductase [Pseudonocardia sp.]
MIEYWGSTITDGARVRADVCIVGAGPVGIAIARELAGAGTSVLLVESGGLEQDDTTDRLNHGENVGLPLPTMLDGRTRALGGATKLWPGQCIRFDDTDLDERSWVPGSGWPITMADLSPFYARAEAWFGIPDDAVDEQAWRRFGMTAPDYDGLLHRSSAYTPHPDIGTHYRAELERSPDVRVLLHATAARVHTTGDGSAARSVELRGLDGTVGHVDADTVVLCGGGIENARLLLLSELGNDHDQVGRHFQEHPTIWVDVDVDRPGELQDFYGLLGRGKIRYLPKIRLDPGVQRDEQVLNAVADVIWEPRETPGLAAARELSSALQGRRRPVGIGPAQLRAAVRDLGPVARAGFRRFAQGRPSAGPVERARLKILAEQSPNPDSRVTLSAERDVLGLPTARVDWRMTERERRTMQVMTAVLDRELRRLGLARLRGHDRLRGPDWQIGFEEACHHMGTTRMSATADTGVVDVDCRVHGVDGLYVCGSSVFPTSGYANPTLTIVAIALRLADHLRSTVPGGRRRAPTTTGP